MCERLALSSQERAVVIELRKNGILADARPFSLTLSDQPIAVCCRDRWRTPEAMEHRNKVLLRVPHYPFTEWGGVLSLDPDYTIKSRVASNWQQLEEWDQENKGGLILLVGHMPCLYANKKGISIEQLVRSAQTVRKEGRGRLPNSNIQVLIDIDYWTPEDGPVSVDQRTYVLP